MFSHIFVGADDLAKAKVFYDAIFAAIGGPEGKLVPEKGRLIYSRSGSNYIIATPINGEPASVANGGTIGFLVDTPAQIDAWYAAGVANGGAPCEDPPGERPGSGFYLAYLRDPQGHKLCALHVLP